MPYPQYTLVQHHGFVFDRRQSAKDMVAVHCILRAEDSAIIRDLNGVLTASFRHACELAEAVNEEGLRGYFSAIHVDRMPIYISKRLPKPVPMKMPDLAESERFRFFHDTQPDGLCRRVGCPLKREPDTGIFEGFCEDCAAIYHGAKEGRDEADHG